MREPCKPFLKWPGGKRWIAASLAELARRYLATDGTYIEPFLGGGALFFQLRPERALLADINPELINTYDIVRDSPEALLKGVKALRVGSRTYYTVRSSKPRTALARATRFVYLNRTAWGGLYRLNKVGEFNVPFGGRSTAPLWRHGLVEKASEALKAARLQTADFAVTMTRASRGDVVFCDPTYASASRSASFVRYNSSNFTWDDQLRLAEAAHAAQRRGATVIMTNVHHHSIRSLYPNATRSLMRRMSTLSSTERGRGRTTEYLIVLPPQPVTTPSERQRRRDYHGTR